jgi:N-acetylmuramoyl-L-alanine amidase
MAIRRQALETVAGTIGDPVKRLKFLQAVAPRVVGSSRRRWSLAIRAILCLIVAAAGVSLLLMRATARVAPPAAPPRSSRAEPKTLPSTGVWQVARKGTFEEYSNGLRIDDSYTVANRPRQLPAPAGIVFHGTESPQAPFEAEHNEALKRIGESLLDYIRRRRSYHFLIDRFGRVYRVVAEMDAANHAGHSVWADDRRRYISA